MTSFTYDFTYFTRRFDYKKQAMAHKKEIIIFILFAFVLLQAKGILYEDIKVYIAVTVFLTCLMHQI